MKTIIKFGLFVYITSMHVNAQVSFTDHTIDNTALQARSVFPCDIDGDGDLDVVATAFDEDKVLWYENTNGAGTFGPAHVITNNADGAYSVTAADFDGDGDMDVVSADHEGYEVGWYENTNGAGLFGSKQVIGAYIIVPLDVYTGDVDGDGDIDILSASFNDNMIAWYENTDGLGTFSAEKIITTDAIGGQSIHTNDIDGDGDLDVLSASHNDDKIAWYENTDGSGTFGPQQIISQAVDGATSVFSIDMDGDGDIDVLSSSRLDNKVAWYENTDGQGTFGPQQIISLDVDNVRHVFAIDLDGDNDPDVISASLNDDKIAWYENVDGYGTFGGQHIITENADGANEINAADMDGDGDIDILSASYLDNTVAWYENTVNLSISDIQLEQVSIYPNPTIGELNIVTQTQLESLTLYNQLGQVVLLESEVNVLDISKLQDGVYQLTVQDVYGNTTNVKVVKKQG